MHGDVGMHTMRDVRFRLLPKPGEDFKPDSAMPAKRGDGRAYGNGWGKAQTKGCAGPETLGSMFPPRTMTTERKIMNYVDGFVLPVPKKNLAAYRRMATKASKIWREHGALEYCECIGDDLAVKFGMPFPKGIQTKPGETVVFAYIVYKSRAHRDKVNANVMKDPRIANLCDPKDMPFDCQRMLYGGFQTMVAA